jgi:hypothetical protein
MKSLTRINTSLLTLVLIVTSAVMLSSNKATAQGETTYLLDNFRGTFWGSPLDSFYRDDAKMDFVKTGEIGVKNTYYIENDNLFIGSVKLDNIYYVFTEDDKFDRLVFKGKTSKSFKEMKYILITKFGAPEIKDINHTIQYSWNVDGVRLYLSFDPDTDFFTVDFYSNYEMNESRKKNRNVADF